MLTKLKAYEWLCTQGEDLRWIAGVFLHAGGPNCAKTLKAITSLVRQGKEVRPVPYHMPTEVLFLNGRIVSPDELRAAALPIQGVK